jgi:hypothetical protein
MSIRPRPLAAALALPAILALIATAPRPACGQAAPKESKAKPKIRIQAVGEPSGPLMEALRPLSVVLPAGGDARPDLIVVDAKRVDAAACAGLVAAAKAPVLALDAGDAHKKAMSARYGIYGSGPSAGYLVDPRPDLKRRGGRRTWTLADPASLEVTRRTAGEPRPSPLGNGYTALARAVRDYLAVTATVATASGSETSTTPPGLVFYIYEAAAYTIPVTLTDTYTGNSQYSQSGTLTTTYLPTVYENYDTLGNLVSYMLLVYMNSSAEPAGPGDDLITEQEGQNLSSDYIGWYNVNLEVGAVPWTQMNLLVTSPGTLNLVTSTTSTKSAGFNVGYRVTAPKNPASLTLGLNYGTSVSTSSTYPAWLIGEKPMYKAEGQSTYGGAIWDYFIASPYVGLFGPSWLYVENPNVSDFTASSQNPLSASLETGAVWEVTTAPLPAELSIWPWMSWSLGYFHHGHVGKSTYADEQTFTLQQQSFSIDLSVFTSN